MARKQRTAACLIAVVLLAASMPLLQAFCIYNDSPQQYTVILADINDASGYKQVIQPHEQGNCCNFAQGGCTMGGGRCGKSVFYIFADAPLSFAGINFGAIANTVSPLLDFISTVAALAGRPEVNAFIAVAQGAAKTATNSPLVVTLDPSKLPNVPNGKGGTVKPVMVANLYNGGVLYFNPAGAALVCWTAPCKDEDVSADGTTGVPKGTAC